MKSNAVMLLNLISQEVGVTDKNAVIGVAVKLLVTNGATVKEAVDCLFGGGAYEKLSSDVYEMLKNDPAKVPSLG